MDDIYISIARKANATAESFANIPPEQHMEELRRLVADSDTFFAFWQDACEPRGFDCIVVKGEDALMRMARAGNIETGRINAITCSSPEDAQAMVQVFGDHRNRIERLG